MGTRPLHPASLCAKTRNLRLRFADARVSRDRNGGLGVGINERDVSVAIFEVTSVCLAQRKERTAQQHLIGRALDYLRLYVEGMVADLNR